MVILFGLLIIFLALGMPVAFAIAIGSAVYILSTGGQIPVIVLAQRITGGTDSFVLLAIPFFMFAGELMNSGGITARLVRFAESIIGGVRGGLAYVVIIVNMIMAGVSGSSAADAAAVGSVMIPTMERNGYKKDFASAVNAAAATVGPIIPPSIGFIVYATIVNVSVGRLFLAGAIPGVLMALYMMVICFIKARRDNLPRSEKTSLKKFANSLRDSYLALFMPVIILGGILLGVVTPTEAAIIAVVYGFIVGTFIYKEIKLSDIPYLLAKSAKEAAVIMFIIACAQAFGWLLTMAGVPDKLTQLFSVISNSAWVFLLLVNIVLLLLGCFMEGTAIMLIVVPVLMPTLQKFGIDYIHFGVIIMLNSMIGLLTPPIGMLLFVITGIANISVHEIVKELWPFMIALLLVLIMLTYIPEISLFLPNLLIK